MRAVHWAAGVRPLLVPIDRVQQHPDNPNNGDLDALIESIQINGFVTAITADARTGYIIAGNHRFQALHALGATEIPVLWVDHWDDSGAKRYMVGDNRTAALAELDQHALATLLGEIAESERGLAGSGYSDDDYHKLLAELALLDQAIPEEPGFGAGDAVLGIFQVVVTFDNADERDEAFASLCDHYDPNNVRTVNL